MINKIIECENRLLQDRKMLNDLLLEYETGNRSEMIRLKIEALQLETNSMNQQIGALRMEYYRYMQGQAPVPPQQAPIQPQQAPVMQQVPPQWQAAPAMMVQPPAQKKDVEKTIGKSLMGIFASVLIFVSLVLFATLVVPYLTETTKMFLMFGVSFAFAIVGNLLLIKNPKNKWFLSLAGCGVGAIYISLLVSRLHFYAITNLVWYVCILGWAIMVSILSRLRSKIFLVIGQIGVLISVLFGVLFCSVMDDGNWTLFLVVYFLLAEAVFYLSHIQREYGKNLMNHIFIAVCLMFLLFVTNATCVTGETAGMAASILVTVLLLVMILLGLFFYHVRKEHGVMFGLLNLVYYLLAVISFSAYFEDFKVILAVVSAVLLVIMELRFGEEGDKRSEAIVGKRIFQIGLFIFLFVQVAAVDVIWEYSGIAVPAILCLLYGFGKKKIPYQIVGFIYAFLFWLVPIEGIWYGLWGGALTILIAVLLYRYKEQYRTWMKAVSYPFVLVYLCVNIARILDQISVLPGEGELPILLAVIAGANICMMKIPVFRRNFRTNQEEIAISIESGIVHIIQMLITVGCIKWIDSTGWHWFAIFLGLVLFVINIDTVLKLFDSRWSSIYVGTKLFVFFLIVLDSFRTPDFSFSIVALLFAIMFIVTGFWAERKLERNFKPIRIYGLILSLLSIVKLILFDIHHDHVLSLAVSFFVSGILCFVISFIYNLVDKKVTKK